MNPIEAVLEATDRYLTTVAGLDDAALRESSALPGWTRAHVVAHVALNAQGLARALRGLRTGEPVAVYDSQEARDADIEERAALGADELAALNQMASLRLAGELRLMKALGEVERTPGGRTLTMPDVVEMRWREAEIHHVDLLAGYDASRWPVAFASYLLEEAARDRSTEIDATLHVRDQSRTVLVGRGGHGIAGTAGELVWWLIGRGTGEGLTSTRPLPTLGPWR